MDSKRLEAFIIFIFLTIITLGLYIPFFWITRQQETIELLSEINQEVKKTDNQREMEQVEKWKEEDREKKPKIVSAYEKYIKPLGLAIVVVMIGIIFIIIGITFFNSF